MDVTRRQVLAGMAATPLVSMVGGTSAAQAAAVPEVKLTWLEGKPGTAAVSTWGTPWPKATVTKEQTFALSDGTPVQSWPIAYWPDGSVKWTAHAIAPAAPAESYTLVAGTAAAPATPVTVRKEKKYVDVDTGIIRARIRKDGPELISQIWRGEVEIARKGHLVNLKQDKIEDDSFEREEFLSRIDKVTVEQSGPVRAVVRIEGKHQNKKGKSWLPFTVRLYFYAGAENFRMAHTFVFDRDGQNDFIAGLGVRFRVPLRDATYDRHIRFVGDGHGTLAEAVKGITGLRRDPGAAVRTAQIAGTRLPDPATWDQRVTTRLQYIPEWGDYMLSQLSSEGFTIKKRTKKGHGWIPVDQGKRASGFGYVGGVSGGLGFGLNDFWQRHPSGLEIKNAHTEEAEVTVWLWSPEAAPMDLRFYHDGMGQDTHEKQYTGGLEITYEDYEPGFGTPYGIARTSDLTFWALAATPSTQVLGAMAGQVRTRPQVINSVEHLVATKVFGGLFAPVDRSHPVKKVIEEHLDFQFDFYRKQVEERHWYGFWDYGDIMHTFDTDRQVWRYDVGGYAWDNSELSPDLWLWYAFVRSGRADIFRFAEAMTRHTGEVDVYHLGPWKGLGTRHGVQHWADSAKQQRISTAVYRRFYYFLTADERTGDLMHELADSEKTFLVLDPIRKIRTEPYTPDPTALDIGLGTDWSGLAAAWFTEWERNGPLAEQAKRNVLGTMESIAALPNGFVQGTALYNINTGRFAPAAARVSLSHLAAMFGLVEICAELIDAIEMPAFKAVWLDYCKYYNATREEQRARYGTDFGNRNLKQGHARLDAYAAVHLKDDALAERAWQKFMVVDNVFEYAHAGEWKSTKVETTLNPTTSAPWISTNSTALFGLSAIQNLALIGDKLPAT